MWQINHAALCAIATAGLLLGAHGVAVADPVEANDVTTVALASSGHCNETMPCAVSSRSHPARDETRLHRRAAALHTAKLHAKRPASTVAHNEPRPLLVAYNWGSAEPSTSCKGENAWSLLCPGAGVIGVSY